MIRRLLSFAFGLVIFEILALILLIVWFGWWAVLFVVVSMAAGAYLLNTLGRNMVERTAKSALGGTKDANLGNDQIKILAALFMLTPGPISTMMGLLLLVPRIGGYARGRVKETTLGQTLGKLNGFFPGQKSGAYAEAVEVELVREDSPASSDSINEISKHSGE